MFQEMSESEIKEGDERRTFLYQSRFAVDNVTAILMDMGTGGFGLYEDVARAKAHAIINLMKMKKAAHE